MNSVGIAVVGLGSAGSLHVRALIEERVPGAYLAGVVCQTARFAAASFLPPGVKHFVSLDALLAEPNPACHAVIIATPHVLHPEQTIAALSAGLHVLCEKPAGVRASEARAMTAAARRYERVYALNFNRRTVPLYQEIRTIIASGKIGSLRRIHWTSTAWLRAQAYYDSSPWRGTWAGEGGGVLINQLPHVLDLWQWIFGIPSRLRAYCGFGKYHAIEVEDEVSVFAEYANGATMVLIGGTGEAPGVERLEVVGDRGTLVAEGNELRVTLLKQGTVDDFIATAPAGFPHPPTKSDVTAHDIEGDLVTGVTRDFVAAIASAEKHTLLAPGEDGEISLMLANAILLSAWEDGAWVRLPVDREHEAAFEQHLATRQRTSRSRVTETGPASVFHLEDSFHSR